MQNDTAAEWGQRSINVPFLINDEILFFINSRLVEGRIASMTIAIDPSHNMIVTGFISYTGEYIRRDSTEIFTSVDNAINYLRNNIVKANQEQDETED